MGSGHYESAMPRHRGDGSTRESTIMHERFVVTGQVLTDCKRREVSTKITSKKNFHRRGSLKIAATICSSKGGPQGGTPELPLELG